MNRNLALPKGPASLRTAQAPNTQTTKTEDPNLAKLTSTIQLSRPFLTKDQITYAQQRTIENTTVYEQRRNQILQFLFRICTNLKFPMRTLEAAMVYYQRYFLHNKFDTTVYYDIAVTALFISSKNEDTIKKLRDIIIVGNQIRNIVMNTDQIEVYKKKILRLEFKLLETISFDFRAYHIEEFLIKIGKDLRVPKEVAYLAWLISVDSFQTITSLKVPPHATAIACLILSSRVKQVDFKCDYSKYYTTEGAVNESLLDLLDLYINSYNYTGLVNFYPELKNKFIDIKLDYTNVKGLREQAFTFIDKDEYFKDRDFTNGERRYMLGSQKKRLYNEISK